MADKIVLCRRDLADIGAPPRLCAKSINPATKPNALKWCADCRAGLPYWPTETTTKPHAQAQEATA